MPKSNGFSQPRIDNEYLKSLSQYVTGRTKIPTFLTCEETLIKARAMEKLPLSGSELLRCLLSGHSDVRCLSVCQQASRDISHGLTEGEPQRHPKHSQTRNPTNIDTQTVQALSISSIQKSQAKATLPGCWVGPLDNSELILSRAKASDSNRILQ